MINRLLRMTRTIQSRFMVAFATMLVVLMAVIIFAVNQRLGNLLIGETRAKGMAIAHSIGATTTNALLSYDYVSLAQAAGCDRSSRHLSEHGADYYGMRQSGRHLGVSPDQRDVEEVDGRMIDGERRDAVLPLDAKAAVGFDCHGNLLSGDSDQGPGKPGRPAASAQRWSDFWAFSANFLAAASSCTMLGRRTGTSMPRWQAGRSFMASSQRRRFGSPSTETPDHL